MLRNISSKLCLVLGLFCTSLMANETKIDFAVLQEQTVIENSLYGKDMNKRIQNFLNSKQSELSNKEERLQKKREVFQRDEVSLSEKERVDRKQDLAKAQRELQGLAEQFEMELQDLHQTEKQNFFKKFSSAVNEVAKAQAYRLILPAGMLHYFDKTVDITPKIIEVLDKLYKLDKK